MILGIFAKQPVPGRVKTRLAAGTSAAWAARVAEAFLLDTLDRTRSLPCAKVVVFDPAEAEAWFRAVAPDGYEVVPQSAGDLGQRLAVFFQQQFAAGAQHVVVIGTDSPTLPPDHITTAFERLAAHDVVIGPATDGGYYLIGCAHSAWPIFDGIAWSSASVFERTVQRVHHLGLRLALLAPWYDVDDARGLALLKAEGVALRLAGTDPRVPRTEALLAAKP